MPRADWHCFMSMQRLYAIPSVASCARCASLSQGGINGLELRALKKLHHREKSLLKGVMFSGFMFIFATSDGDLLDFRVILS